MAVDASPPHTIVFVAPPASDVPAPHRLIGSGRILSDLLCSEVAACVAAVGHRLRVAPRAEGRAGGLVTTPVERPALILWGLHPSETSPPDLPPEFVRDAPVIPVALDGVAAPPGTLSLPAGSRHLCRTLAGAAPEGVGTAAEHRRVVLAHQGDGPDGEARWPGLGWALTLLWAGPGRGVLVDAQGPGGSLSDRLRDLAPPAPGSIGWHTTGAVPVPGPALMARLPGAGGVRWWGWAAPADSPATREAPEAHETLWTEREACIQSAHEASAWTVVDVGRDLDRARAAAAGGTPVVLCTDRPAPAGPAIHPDVVLRTTGAGGSVPFRAADWAGTSIAAWDRAARRGSGRRLAAEIGLRLEQVAGPGPGGVLAGRVCP